MNKLTSIFVGFALGAVTCAMVSYFLIANLWHQAMVGKLIDNVLFYRYVENNKPEMVQSAIESSLDDYVKMTEESQQSMWVAPDVNDKRALSDAKALQQQLQNSQ